MQSFRDHPRALMGLAVAVAAAVTVAILMADGPGGFAAHVSHLRWGWLGLVVAGALAAPAGYTLCFQALTRMAQGPELPAGLAARIVAIGFGPFLPMGGLHVDRRMLETLKGDDTNARTHVLAIGLLELALLTPVAWVCAILLQLSPPAGLKSSQTWPWIVLVPAGFGIAFAAIAWVRARDPDPRRGGLRGRWARLAHGASFLLRLPGRGVDGWSAILGMVGYWVADILSFYAATQFVDLRVSLAAAVLAYATGYLLTRRSTPLGGAGFTEALLCFALHWVGQPVEGALAAVVVYRIFNFVLPGVPALKAREDLHPLVEAEKTVDVEQIITPTPG
ncbi:MAG TPA: lysylphosphatidylglycerol synthase domain-containing protein [Solirubrobacteraceae bacterium]|nr:lysylphosphatidylglycerol synthase domain-containing protein [Solirubrobacteraceae bacterium]